MKLVCLDLEGVLIPEVWVGLAELSGLKELRKTTRTEPDYEKLMKWRIGFLKEHGLTINDINRVLDGLHPLEGAKEFLDELRSLVQVVILTDSFEDYLKPLMKQLGYPMCFANSLVIDRNTGIIEDFTMRDHDGKRKAIEHFRAMGCEVFASGDSYNDLPMVLNADHGCLFKAPDNILEEYPHLRNAHSYDEFLTYIKESLDL